MNNPVPVPDCASVFVTTTFCAPAEPEGVVHVIDVALTRFTLVHAEPPTVTEGLAKNPVPVIAIDVPPAAAPDDGDTPDTVGAARYVNNVFAAFDCPPTVTTTLAVPAVPAGVVHVIDVAEATVTPVHAEPPTVTPVAPVKLVPVIVIDVPPAAAPDDGDTPDTVGAATAL